MSKFLMTPELSVECLLDLLDFDRHHKIGVTELHKAIKAWFFNHYDATLQLGHVKEVKAMMYQISPITEQEFKVAGYWYIRGIRVKE